MARLITPSRVLMILVVLVALAAALIVLSSGASPAKICVGRNHTTVGLSPGSLTPSAGSSASFMTLPPSHDNDAGRSRIPDATADADSDTSRSRVVCTTK